MLYKLLVYSDICNCLGKSLGKRVDRRGLNVSLILSEYSTMTKLLSYMIGYSNK